MLLKKYNSVKLDNEYFNDLLNEINEFNVTMKEINNNLQKTNDELENIKSEIASLKYAL